MNKFLITQSLLSSWNWAFKKDDGYSDFLKTLNREPIQWNNAMLDGQRFENLIQAYCEGAPLDPRHEWASGIQQTGDILQGAAFQVKLSRPLIIKNVEFVVYGILDALKCGIVYDMKFSKKYYHQKYLDSIQHPTYFYLCPQAKEFIYLSCDGKDVYKETYRPDDIEPIESEISRFMDYLDRHNLTDIYCEKWQSKY